MGFSLACNYIFDEIVEFTAESWMQWFVLESTKFYLVSLDN